MAPPASGATFKNSRREYKIVLLSYLMTTKPMLKLMKPPGRWIVLFPFPLR
jgi:hypothetical protein